jgi:tetraacyldisaccharide 4'-kinase
MMSKTITARLIYLLYQLLLIALSPALGLYLLYRGFRNPAYFTGLKERFGFLPASLESTGMGSVWFHAVSVGEVLSAVELIRRLRAERPDLDVFVSTTTLSGRMTADQRLRTLVRGIFYSPFDYRFVLRCVLRRLRPAVVVVMETEIWPNLFRESKRAGAQLLVINGRISDRTLPRYRNLNWLFRHALTLPDSIWVQSEQDVERYILAGAPRERVMAAGNLKYDFQPPKEIAPDLQEFFDLVKPASVWVAASTMPPAISGDPDEDDVVIEAWTRVHRAGMLLVLAPRHPDRFDAAADKLRRAGASFVRRTQLTSIQLPAVLLLDSIGDLAALFARADVVFMGGTLAHRGGHNILEPAYFAKPVIAGPHMENFAEIAREFESGQALMRIANGATLGAAIDKLLQNHNDIGVRAQSLAQAKRGVVDRILKRVLDAIGEGIPEPPRTLVARIVLAPLSWIWTAGHSWNEACSRREVRSLSARVVSIGGLVMGGSGKSPMAAHLAESLMLCNQTPAILTRGYRRKDARSPLIIHRGVQASVSRTGDEAQMFIRRQIAHVGIGPDRYEIGHTMELQLDPDIFLLDDGFQHVRLKRDLDIVLIDATNPWGGGMFPLGHRREPLDALARAGVVVLTRVPPKAATTGIKKVLQQHTKAPIFRSRMVPEPWNSSATKVGAFCGIGSPSSFWRTLDDLGLTIVHRRAFRDHHQYSTSELESFAREAAVNGAEVLVATEKDMMNLPPDLRLPLEIRCVRIRVEIENEAGLMNLVLGE